VAFRLFAFCGQNRAGCPHGRLPATLRYSLLACARSRSCCRSTSVRSGSACVRSSSRSRSSSVARSSSSARSGSSRIRSGSASVRSSSGRSRCGSRVASRGSSLVAALAACSKCHSRQQGCYEEGFLHDHVLLWLKVSNSANLPVMCSKHRPGPLVETHFMSVNLSRTAWAEIICTFVSTVDKSGANTL
jgi:hypothetical protein